MRYLSVCSGIEAATAAWHPLGWIPAAFSEIEAFPRAVLKHHYPQVPLHGDFTTIKGDEYGAIDLLVGGTPCQDFSVAGLRAGIAGDRGNLTLEFLRLAARTRPRWVVWENVPGVLSSDGGRALGAFLGGLAELGYGFAYRVLDAQHFGLAQRRARVFVVGHLGDWRRAAAVLFERESLSGHPAPRREARKDVAPTIAARTRGGGGLGTDFDCDGGLIAGTLEATMGKSRGAGTPVGSVIANTLSAARGAARANAADLETYIPTTTNGDDLAPTLDAHHDRKWGSNQWVNNGFGILEPPVVMSSGQANAEITRDQSPSLTCLHEAPIVAQAFKPSHFTRGKDGAPSDLVPPLSADADKGDQDTVVAIAFDTTQITHPENRSNPQPGDACHPLASAGHPPAIAFQSKSTGDDGIGMDISGTVKGEHPPAIAFSVKDHGADATEELSPTLRSGGHDKSHANGGVMPAIAFGWQNSARQGASASASVTPTLDKSKTPAIAFSIMPMNSGKDYKARETDVAQPLMAGGPVGGNQGGDYVAFAQNQLGEIRAGDVFGTLNTNTNASGRNTPMVQSATMVRRLTPEECEKLQGFSDIEETLTISVCSGVHPKNHARAADPNRKSPSLAGGVAERRSSTTASSVESSSSASHPKTSKHAAVHVEIDCEAGTIKGITHDGELFVSARIADAEKRTFLATPIAGFALLAVATLSWSDQETEVGRADGSLRDSDSSAQRNGAKSAVLSGSEIQETAKDVGASIIRLRSFMQFTTSVLGPSSLSCGLNYRTLCCSAVAAIASFIPERIRTAPSYDLTITRRCSFTLVPYRGKPAADGPRYKALGNSMAVPVMHWIGRRIQMVEDLSKPVAKVKRSRA